MQRGDLEVHRPPGVTRAQEIHVHAVRQAIDDGSTGRHQRLRGDVPARDVMRDFVDLVADEKLRVDLFEFEGVEDFAERDDGWRRGHARIMPLSQVAAKPLEGSPPGVRGCRRVVAGSAIVEKGVIGVGFYHDVVDQPGALEGGPGRRF